MAKARSRRRRVNEKGILKPVVRAVIENVIAAVRTTPLGVLLIAGVVFFHIEALPETIVSSIPTIAYATLAFGMMITAGFNRSRAFFILLVLFLSLAGMVYSALQYGDSSFVLHGIQSTVSLLIPLNLLFFASISEGEVLSSKGKRNLAFILLQIVFVWGLVFSKDVDFFTFVNEKQITFLAMPQTPVPDIAVISFIIAGVFLLIKRKTTNIHFKMAVCGALTAVALAHHFIAVPVAVPFFYAVAGLIIILSMIQDYYVKAYLDELTGLPSRRSLNEELMNLDGDYVIAMVDVDFFKKFNDTYGHDAGDDVLRLIAAAMKDFKYGKPFRYGGEEFTILFPGKKLTEAMAHLEELREKIARRKFILRANSKKGTGRKVNVTVSIGAAESSRKLTDPEEVIKQADQALYRAKESGRNRVSK